MFTQGLTYIFFKSLGKIISAYSNSIFSYFRVFQVLTISCVWPTALKLGCVTNLDTLFLMMGFIYLIDEIQFMLISSRHVCIRSIYTIFFF